MSNALDRPRPGLVIFDCDGVLVDSELIDARIRSECFRAEGFELTADDLRNQPGISGAGLAEMIELRFGRPMPDGFMQATRAKIMRAFTDELRAIDGIAELLGALNVSVCVASNSHTDRLRHSLEVTGLLRFFDPHVFSAVMVDRGKPAPDLFLFAAEKLGIAPPIVWWWKTVSTGSRPRGPLGWRSSVSVAAAIANPIMPSAYSRPAARGYSRK